MDRSFAYAGLLALMATPSVAIAASNTGTRTISLPAQDMTISLQAIAHRYSIELLFSSAIVGERQAPPITGKMDALTALKTITAGTNLVVTRTPDGSYIIAAASVAVSEQPVATPEILVIGRRTQNTDVRRTENDVRPYQVLTRESIATSHAATVEELATKRLPANDQGATLSQQGIAAQGSTASSIDLRGLGTSQTLILVDGRRLPSMPAQSAGFNQSDLNALPPEAIERVEAITATAGGIYGPGATAGVVNFVLRRDYRGIDLTVSNGVTFRGDAPYRRADFRLGFTPDGGGTDVMVDVSRSVFGGLDVGDRDFSIRANARILANDPLYAATGSLSSRSLTLVANDGSALLFKPSYGGGALGSSFTYVPTASGRSTADLVAALTRNAGKVDPHPSPDATGDDETLLSGRRTTSVIASARHRSGAVELFADLLYFDNEGHARSAYPLNKTGLSANDPTNPFQQYVTIYAPDPAQTIDYDFRSRLTRLTGGIIIDLPGSWRAEADYSHGSGVRSYVSGGQQLTLAGIYRYYASIYGPPSDVSPRNPLGKYSDYLSSFTGLFGSYGYDYHQRNLFDDQSLRLAGPLAPLAGGNMTATFLAEQRRERFSGGSLFEYSPLVDASVTEALPAYAQTTRSVYGELRAPLIDARSGFRPLRGLEVQLAVRRDWTATKAVLNLLSIDGAGTRTVRNAGTVFTAGAKASPVSGILLRGSISTGQQPLTVSDLSRFVLPGLTYRDPRRPGDYEAFDEVAGGAPHPRPERARSVSAGVVIQPPSLSGLRISIDYTHIEKRGEGVVTAASSADYFIANEAQYPERVTRQALTPEDAALGYTAGSITRVDSSSTQNGRTSIDAIDSSLDYSFPLHGGTLVDLHAGSAWQPRFRRFVGFGVASRDYAGASDGAPTLRASGGVRLTKGSLTVAIDGQLTGRYRITSALELLNDAGTMYVQQQGGIHVPAQATVDLAAEYRFSLAGQGFSGRPRTLAVRLGVQDALNGRPATDVSVYGSYNTYLDPRRRRFELTLFAGF